MMIDFDAARVAMVDRQVRPSDVTRLSIIDAMLAIPRERFAPRSQRDVAYADAQIPLGGGRAMLDPRTLAKMLEAAGVERDELLLDVGSATGYSAAVASKLAATVVALEQDEAMAATMEQTLAALDIDNVVIERGPLVAGAPRSGPYDVIMVQGAVAAAPDALLAQLKEGGRLVAVMASGPLGQAQLFTRVAGAIARRSVFDAAAPVLPGFDAAPTFTF